MPVRSVGKVEEVFTDGRHCKKCDALLRREKLSSGRYESWKHFKTRKKCYQCDPRLVRKKLKLKLDKKREQQEKRKSYGETEDYKRFCWWCKGVIPRSRTPSGRLESTSKYTKKRYCSQKCELKAIRAENETKVGMDMQRKYLKTKRGRKSKEQKRFLAEMGEKQYMPEGEQMPIAPRQYQPPELKNRVKDIKKLAQAYTIDAMNALVDEVHRSRGGPRIDAAKAILERGWGKPDANVNVTRKVEDMTESELLELLGYQQDNSGNIIDAEFHRVVSDEELEEQFGLEHKKD